MVATLGQRIDVPDEVPQTWQDRVGQVYLADLMIMPPMAHFLTFDTRDGLLLALTPISVDVIYPQNDSLAYVGNTTSCGDGAITATQAEGAERLNYLTIGYFPIDQVKGYTLGEDEGVDIKLRNSVPLSMWRKFSVTQGGTFDRKQVQFAVSPGDDLDAYVLYDENADMLAFRIGKNAIFELGAGAYYLAFNPDINSSGEKVLTSRIAD